jgi:surface protein
MKKSILFRALALLAALACALGASAYDFMYGGNYYRILTGNTVAVTYRSGTYNSYSGEVYIPETVTYGGTTYNVTAIDQVAFYKCSNLKHVSLPKTIQEIGELAFRNCPSLESVYCHAMTVPTLSESAFDASAYDDVTVMVPLSVYYTYTEAAIWQNLSCLDNLPYHFEKDGFYYYIDEGSDVYVARKEDKFNQLVYEGDITIPERVTALNQTYFVKGIDVSAFANCYSLTSVKMGRHVGYIGSSAFAGCTSLTEVTIPASVQKIESSAFDNCTGLKRVTIPEEVSTIFYYAFSGCTGLEDIYCYAETPPTVYSSTFSSYNATLHVPDGCRSSYMSKNYWKNFNIVAMPGLNGALNVVEDAVEFECADYPWRVVEEGDRTYAISMNYGVPNSESSLYGYVDVPVEGGTLSFDFKAWGEGSSTAYDACLFFIDGVEKFRYGARDNDWETYSAELAPGEHTLEWRYTKDNANNPEGDYFAVDNVQIVTNPEAYACYTPSNTTLTFYYDTQRSSRPGTTYYLNTGAMSTDWEVDGTNASVTKVVFDPSFAGARPTTTYDWFYRMVNLQSITGMEYLNTSEVTKMSWMFGSCSSLTNLDLSHFNTSKVTTMTGMFDGCSRLTSLDLSSFNTSKVTDMSRMFWDNRNLRTIYVGNGWSTATVTSSNDMFYNCTSLVGGQGTTYNSSNPMDKTYAHIDGGTSNPGYFTAEGDAPWTNPDEAYACYTPSYTTLTFYYDNQRSSRPGTTYDLNTGNNEPAWETDGTNASVTQVVFDPSFADARPTTTYDWFYHMENLQTITGMSYLNTSEVTNMSFMFAYCGSLRSADVSHFNTSQVIRMWAMFSGCSSLTSLDLSSFNTSQLMYLHYMFNGCSSLTSLDLSSFNTSYVMDASYMFKNCSNLRTIYVGNGWSTAIMISSTDMFYGCTSLVGGRGTTWNSSNPTDKTYAHIDGGPSNPGYFTEFIEPYACYTESNTTLTFYYDTQRSSRPGTTYDLNTGTNHPGWETDGTKSNVTKVVFDPSFADARPTSTYDWFYGMRNLLSIMDMNYLNTNEVTEMRYMFCGCNKLTSLDVSHFNTSQLTTMRSMFDSCYGLTSLDLSSFNTSQVFNMGDMFHDCNNLRTIYVGDGWSTAAVTYSTNMFNGCTSLVGGQGTTYDADHVGAEYAHIDGGPSNPGYFTEKPTFLRGDVNGDTHVSIADVTALIDYLLSHDASSINVDAADCNLDTNVSISDVTALIDYLLSGSW